MSIKGIRSIERPTSATVIETISNKQSNLSINADKLDSKEKSELATSTSVYVTFSGNVSKEKLMIEAPSIVTPIDGANDVSSKTLVFTSFDTGPHVDLEHEYTTIQLSTHADFNIVDIEYDKIPDGKTTLIINEILPETTYYVRCKYGSGNIWSRWSDITSFTTGVMATIETPLITIVGYPDNIDLAPTITGSPFKIDDDVEPHLYSVWKLYKDNTIVFDSGNDGNNLESITIPSGILNPDNKYRVELSYYTQSYSSEVATLEFIIAPELIIETPTIDVFGLPGNVSVKPTFTGSPFNLIKGNGAHDRSTWKIADSSGNIVYELIRDANNLESMTVPDNVLVKSSYYKLSLVYHSGDYSSLEGILEFNTADINYQDKWVQYSGLTANTSSMAATLMANGDLLISGGIDSVGHYNFQQWLLPKDSNEIVSAPLMPTNLVHHKIVAIDSDKAVYLGGISSTNGNTWPFIQDIRDGSYMDIRPLPEQLIALTATLLPTGDILIVGGYSNNRYFNKCYLYDVNMDQYYSAADLPISIAKHTATLLPNGEVLVVGGVTPNPSKKVYGYNYKADIWHEYPSLPGHRHSHGASLLSNGLLLITGGIENNVEKSVYTYDPNNGSIQYVQDLPTPRKNHSQITLMDGRPVVIGGSNGISLMPTIYKYT